MGFGLKLIRSTGMDGFTGNQESFPIQPSNTSPIFTGDLVRLDGGWIVEASGAEDNADFSALGVFQGCRYVDSNGDFVYRSFWDGAANRENIEAYVGQPDGAMFLIKGAPDTNYSQSAIGGRFGVAYSAGSTIYGDSRVTLAATPAATGPLLVHRLHRTPNNDFDTDGPVFEVSIARKQGHPALA